MESIVWIVSLGCFCTVLHYSVYFIQLFNVNCHWTKSGSLYDAVNQWTSPSLDKRPGSESFSTKKDFFTYFLLNWALNDDFRFNQYSRKLHDAESGPSSSSFSKRCLPHFQQFSCSLMILLFHFLSCSYF